MVTPPAHSVHDDLPVGSTDSAGDQFADRFGGIQRLYGKDGAARLRDAHVAVIGIGGVGSWAAEALARSGVGRITLVDLDDVCTTNINRQVHAVTEQIGRPKVEAMAQRIDGISPGCDCEAMHAFFNERSVDEFFAHTYDYIIDAIDTHYPKCLLIDICRRDDVPLITCGGTGGLTDPTQVCIDDLNRSHGDPLLAKVRKHLRQQHGFPRKIGKRLGVECVYSAQTPVYPAAAGGVCEEKSEREGSLKMDCATGFGAASFVTGAFGFAAASRAVSVISDTKS